MTKLILLQVMGTLNSFSTLLINYYQKWFTTEYHYRYLIHKVLQNIDAVHLDVDFAENLSIPVKCEPQSLHWSHEQVTIHSRIVPTGHKCYHPYVSDDRKHNQHLPQSCLEKMLEALEVQAFDMSNVLIESGNCSGQYKSSPHFHGMLEIANRYNIPVIWIYGDWSC